MAVPERPSKIGVPVATSSTIPATLPPRAGSPIAAVSRVVKVPLAGRAPSPAAARTGPAVTRGIGVGFGDATGAGVLSASWVIQ